MNEDALRTILGVVATIAAAVPASFALTTSRHRLGQAERLTKLSQSMAPSSARSLLEDVRDELAIE